MQETIPSAETQPETAQRQWHPLLDYLLLIISAGSLVTLDTWTKALVDRNIPVGGAWLPGFLAHYIGYFRITHFHNTGTAFSMFASADRINLIISILAFIVTVFIVIIFPRIDRKERLLRVAVILQLGGTVGNLISRLHYGYVLDFISIGDFAVFNIADASLVVGASLMVLAVLFEEINEKQKADEKSEAGEDTEVVTTDEHS
jgi:signal peptidase II